MNRKGYIGALLLALYASLSFAQQGIPIDTVCIFDPPSRLAVTSQGTMQFKWSVGQGVITSNPIDSSVVMVSWANGSAGLHTVKVVALDSQLECPGDTSEALVLVTAPQIAKAKFPEIACQGEEVVLESNIAGDFMWKGGSTNRFQSFIAKADTTTYLISLNGSCTNDTIEFSVKVNSTPTAGISLAPDTVIFGEEMNLFFRGLANTSDNIEWFLNDQFIDVGRAIKIEFSSLGKSEIMQIVTNGNCSDTAYHDIYIDDQFRAHFPNAFTPNGDGNNDLWFFDGVGHKSYDATVFNRWGGVIYNWNNTSQLQAWDGTESGQLSPEGTYVYKVGIEDMRGQMHYFTDYFTLIR